MSSDYTQQQSLGGLERAEQLSMQSTQPPSEVEGYRVDKLLGQGAFGQVWLAHDLNTGRQVAIKFYLNRGNVNWSLINREVKHLVNMSTGRYIVQVLNVGWEAEPPYYVMEHLENGSLEDMVRAQGSLSIPHSAKMFREIAEGLSYAHSKGVLHCDLKPANVLLDHDWRPRLADFGQSRMSDEQTPSLGTLFFMAPEQADLEATPDSAWDVYALGAIAYCMLVGSPPYRTPEVVETLDTADSLSARLERYRETIRKARKPRLHYRRRGIDKSLCQIIDRCLSANPERRYSNVQQVIGALDSRARSRTRLPMYLMGIVGPILLLLLMLFFSSRSISVARNETIQSIQDWSVRSNKDQSLYAAQYLEGEIGSLFKLVEEEAQESELRTLLADVSSEGKSLLDTLADGQSHPDEAEKLQKLPEQKQLFDYLSARLETILAEQDANSAIFNTIFVNNARGTNVGICFANPEEQTSKSPVGRNFAYRSYFTGKRADALPTLPPSSFDPTRYTHLSSSFRSTATGKWKVGISSPIWPSQSNGDHSDEEPIGVLVLTINLGNFKLLVEDSESQSERFAALVDGREGNGQGILLQHPFLTKLERSNDNTLTPQIDPRFFSRLTGSEGITNYKDPSAKFDGGEEFEGDWIAALKQVQLPRKAATSKEQRDKSDLWVLVQEPRTAVTEPVEELGAKLLRETYMEFAALLAVMLVLWFCVFRLGQSALRGGGGKGSGNFPSSSFGSTIDSGH